MSDSDDLGVTPKIVIYGKEDCRFCDEAKKAFDSVELSYEYKSLAKALGLPGKDGKTPAFNEEWRYDGTADLMAQWAYCGQPTPFIVIDGKGYEKLKDALDIVNYSSRKRAVVMRKRREKEEANSRTDA